jgi:hypothetical protein
MEYRLYATFPETTVHVLPDLIKFPALNVGVIHVGRLLVIALPTKYEFTAYLLLSDAGGVGTLSPCVV